MFYKRRIEDLEEFVRARVLRLCDQLINVFGILADQQCMINQLMEAVLRIDGVELPKSLQKDIEVLIDRIDKEVTNDDESERKNNCAAEDD